jgi:hypothetical protein
VDCVGAVVVWSLVVVFCWSVVVFWLSVVVFCLSVVVLVLYDDVCRCVVPPKNVVPCEPLTEEPNSSSGSVSTPTAITNAAPAVASTIFQWTRPKRGRAVSDRYTLYWDIGGAEGSRGAGSSRDGPSAGDPAPAPWASGTRSRAGVAVRAERAARRTVCAGRLSVSLTTVTMTGVIAALINVPLCQK